MLDSYLCSCLSAEALRVQAQTGLLSSDLMLVTWLFGSGLMLVTRLLDYWGMGCRERLAAAKETNL